MECTRVQDLLPDYAVDMLDGRTRSAVAQHLADCAGCREEMALQERVMTLVETQGFIQPPPGLFNAVRNQIEAGAVAQDPRPWWSFIYSRPARALAMAGAVGALALGVLLPVSSPRIPSGTLHTTSIITPGKTASNELANSIRQHAMSASDGPLADRVAWEAMAQLVTENGAARGGRQPAGVE